MSFPLYNEEGVFVRRVSFYGEYNTLVAVDKELIKLLDSNDPEGKYYQCIETDEEEETQEDEEKETEKETPETSFSSLQEMKEYLLSQGVDPKEISNKKSLLVKAKEFNLQVKA